MSTYPTCFLPFSLFVTSVLSSKILHIYIHSNGISLLPLLLFLPTLLLPDILLICGIWLLCLGHRGTWAILGCFATCVLAMVTYGTTAMSLGFFLKTGGEVKWKSSLDFASDPKGMKVLMSEAQSTVPPAIALLIASWLARPVIFSACNTIVASFGAPLRKVRRYFWPYLNKGYDHAMIEDFQEIHTYHDSEQSEQDSFSESSLMESEKQPEVVESLLLHHGKDYICQKLSPLSATLKYRASQCMEYVLRAIPAALPTVDLRIVDLTLKEQLQYKMPGVLASTKLRIIVFLAVLYILRPSKPYNHLSNTLPLQLLEVFDKGYDGQCRIHSGSSYAKWPLPEVIDEEYWILPESDFKGWAPGADSGYRNRTPEWLSDIPTDGFYRWQAVARNQNPPIDVPERELGRPGGTLHDKDLKEKCADLLEKLVDYDPADDPLRISNLNQDILRPLRRVMKEGSAVINHVMIVTMESIREELFPLMPGSGMHKMILEANPPSDWDDVNKQLDRLGRNAQKITGRFGSFTDAVDLEISDSEEDFGGININGALTGSTFSFKSFLGSHCGVWALPVNMLEETYSQIYQPCLPHILNLLNAGKDQKDNENKSIDPVERKWKSIYLQSITDLYDRQDQLNRQIGFDHVEVKETIEIEPGFDEEEINYYGYPERAIKPHMRKALQDAVENDERLFLSHFTSSTHHPWATPKDFDDFDYMGDGHDDFNHHLNSIRFVDEWLGEIFDLLEEFGVYNETLVVFVGDHGTAFYEDGPSANLGPHENKHISNWRVPLAFHHPHLPRVQLDVNATSISILPTILDLLIQTDSLNSRDKSIASDLMHDYEGQSLIRPYVKSQDSRRAWNFGVVNAGGGMILMTSADTTFKMSMPLGSIREFTFVDLAMDPLEKDPMEFWVFDELLKKIRDEHGRHAEQWAVEAEKVLKYFVDRQHRLWKYADQL